MTSPLFQGTVAEDLMERDVITASPTDTIHDALSVMSDYYIGALPILNNRDRCVGVVTAWDILSYEENDLEEEAEHTLVPYYDVESAQWQSIEIRSVLENLPDVPLSEVMSRELISVTPSTPITEVARIMQGNQIHRVLVLNENQCLHGIISSFDFVTLVADCD